MQFMLDELATAEEKLSVKKSYQWFKRVRNIGSKNGNIKKK